MKYFTFGIVATMLSIMSFQSDGNQVVNAQEYWNRRGKYPKCLYCKLKDETSYFSYSYSYCKDRGFDSNGEKREDICVKDQWNYINQWCESQWVPGWMIDVTNDCEAIQIKEVCPDFVSSPSMYGKNDTRKNGLILPEGAMCTMTIDAQQAVARVKITEETAIGVLWNEYDRKEWITIPEGFTQQITLYNANEVGPQAFTVVFTGAQYLKMSIAIMLSLMLAGSL